MTYQNVNSSIISKVMNSFNEMFPLARMFPLAVMHTPPLIQNLSPAPLPFAAVY